MASHLARRGGYWWVRLVVPDNLRVVAGRREFCRSTRTSDLGLAKVIAASIPARWRVKLFQWERGQVLDDDVLKVIDSAPAFTGAGYMTLRHAAEASGLGFYGCSSGWIGGAT